MQKTSYISSYDTLSKFKKEGKPMKHTFSLISLMLILLLSACTQETQNNISRSIQNWTGTNGILDVYAGNKLVHRFIEIDKLSTAKGTTNGVDRPYRFGYGIHDMNFNNQKDEGEKRVYFEFSDYSTSYIFYEKN
jgi:hypothetical protein